MRKCIQTVYDYLPLDVLKYKCSWNWRLTRKLSIKSLHLSLLGSPTCQYSQCQVFTDTIPPNVDTMVPSFYC